MRWSTVVLHVLWSYKVINVSCIKGDSIENRANNHWGIWKSLLAKITEGDRISTNFSKISSQSLSCKSQTFLPKGRQKQLLLSLTILVIATGFSERLPRTMSEISSDLPKVSFRLEKEVFISSLIRSVNESPRCGMHFFPALRLSILCLWAKNTQASYWQLEQNLCVMRAMEGPDWEQRTAEWSSDEMQQQNIPCNTRTCLKAPAWQHAPLTHAWKHESVWNFNINVICVPIPNSVFQVLMPEHQPLISMCTERFILLPAID